MCFQGGVHTDTKILRRFPANGSGKHLRSPNIWSGKKWMRTSSLNKWLAFPGSARVSPSWSFGIHCGGRWRGLWWPQAVPFSSSWYNRSELLADDSAQDTMGSWPGVRVECDTVFSTDFSKYRSMLGNRHVDSIWSIGYFVYKFFTNVWSKQLLWIPMIQILFNYLDSYSHIYSHKAIKNLNTGYLRIYWWWFYYFFLHFLAYHFLKL